MPDIAIPQIMKSAPKLYGDSVMPVIMGHTNARAYHSRNHARCLENWRMYTAHNPELGLGQWPEASVNYMIEQKRNLLQYNFVRVIVDTIAGGIMQLPYDPEIFPINQQITSLVTAVKKAMYSDKEIMDWNASYFELVRAGLIYQGCIKIGVDYSIDPLLGNIALKPALMDSVVPDPSWTTWASKDCQVCWHESWHNIESLSNIMPERIELIKSELDRQKKDKDAPKYGAYMSSTPYSGNEDTWGSQYKLIQEYRMVDVTKKQEYATTIDGEIAIPDMPDDMKPHWLNTYHPTWQPEYVYVKPEKERVCMVTSVCPSISSNQMLEHRPCEAQIGCLPFKWWSASRENGEPSSIVDSVKDAQTNINYCSSLIQYKLQIEGGGGSQFVDRSGFASNSVYNDYIKNSNNPAKKFEVRSGFLADGKTPAVPTRKSEFPNEAYQMINHIVNVILPHISKVTPAMRGIEDTSGTSGKLYEMLKIQSDQAVYTIHYGLRIFWNEVYEAYFMQAAHTYAKADPSNPTMPIPRTFSINHGMGSVTLNERRTLADGRIAIVNDVSQLKKMRLKVIISERPQSPTDKVEKLYKIDQYIKTLGPSKPATAQIIMGKATQLMEITGEEDSEILDVANMKEVELAYETLEMQILQTKLQRMGLQEQVKQLEAKINSVPQPAPPGVPGNSAENIPALPPRELEQEQVTAMPNPPAPAPQAMGGGSETIAPAPQAPQGEPV